MKNELYWIWLTQLDGVGPVTARKLLEIYKSPKTIYEITDEEFISLDKNLGKSTIKKIIESKEKSLEQAKGIFESCEKRKVKILTLEDKTYPEEVKTIKNLPIVLYYKGNIREDSMGIAVIGSRRCTDYGKRIAIEVSRYLSESNISVISGMSKGIDGYAHTSALKNNGYTLAFIGSGLNYCYPEEHKKLMDAIIEKGAVISEYPPYFKPYNRFFVERNRIVAAWSKAILVAEAGEASGTMSTVNYALEFKRKVYAVPNSIYSNESKGTNKLLKDGKATLFLDNTQLLQFSKEKKKDEKSYVNNLEKEKIIEYLKKGPMYQEELLNKLGCDYNSIVKLIMELEMSGQVDNCGGQLRVVASPGV